MRLFFPHAVTSYDDASVRRIAEQEINRCLAVMARSRQRLVFGWITMLRIAGIPVPSGHDMDESQIYVCVKSDKSARSRMNGVAYKLWRGEVSTVSYSCADGTEIRMVSPATVCAMMAPHCSLWELVGLIDSLIRRSNPDRALMLADLEKVASSEKRFRGWRTFREALSLARMNTDSPAETTVRLELRRRRIGGNWLVNCRVLHRPSGKGWHVDLCDPALGVIIEYQGSHHWSRRQGERDSEKFVLLQRYGCVVITITAADMATQEARDLIFETILEVVRRQRRMRAKRRLRLQVAFKPMGDGASGGDTEGDSFFSDGKWD